MVEIGNIKAFDVKELSKMFNISPQSIRALLKTGKLKGNKMGTRWYVTQKALQEYFEVYKKYMFIK